MDRTKHAAYIKQYQTELFPRFEVYAHTLEEVLRAAVKRYAPLAIVQTRPKAVPSFAEKIIRKGYASPFVQMTDLCGARIVTVTEAQLKAVSVFIKEAFEVDYANSLDVGERLGVGEFGYRSVHYIVQFRPGKCLGVRVPRAILPTAQVPFKAEIQLRTVLQHGWAEVLHDRIYKNSIKMPRALEREGARLAALLEEGDGLITRVVEDIDAYVVDIGAYMTKAMIAEEVAKLDLILSNEKNAQAKEALALRMTRLHRADNQWTAITSLLRPFAKNTKNAVTLREYGNALCEAHAANPNSDDYAQGQEVLLHVLALDATDAATHAALARSYQRQPREETEVRKFLRNAYHLAPGNPYHLAAYMEYELLRAPSTALIPMVTPTVREAIATCKRHIEVGIELPQAYLTLGKLHLLLGEAYASLDAYARGLRMILDRESGLCPDCLERELDALARLDNAKEGLPGDAWARESLVEGLRRLLLLGLYLASGKTTHLNALKKTQLAKLPATGRVLMVAGGCSKETETQMKAYAPMVCDALTDFQGLVISGGTRAGVSGIVAGLGAKRDRPYKTVGYFPNAPGIRGDKRYNILTKTAGHDFSPLDAIQAWVDIVCAGIAPARVSVLGINGGAISGVEYRIGLALGAAVGVIVGSGRAADALLEDRDWNTLARPLGLLNDPMTLRAFINPGDDSLPKSKREALAKAIHIAYCKGDTATLNKRILKANGQPWDKLAETFKQANYAQADYIGEILRTEGYTLGRAKGQADNSAITFTPQQVKRMAEKEHGRWNVDRLRDGWRPGKRDDAKKSHDCLVAWKDLPDDIRQYDRDAALSWPKLLESVGIQINKSPGGKGVRKNTP